MDPRITSRYQRAHDDASAKGGDMPSWMLERCICHALRLAQTNPYRASLGAHETAWGSVDGFTDEILRRRMPAWPHA